MNRRKFLLQAGLVTAAGGALGNLLPLTAVGSDMTESTGLPEISLAQWSLHRAFFSRELDPRDFASIAAEQFNIHAIEYVNWFYGKKGADAVFWREMRDRSDEAGVRNLLIMIDGQGALGATDDKARAEAVENHFQWVDAAATLGCHAVRVNAHGEGGRDEVGTALVEGLGGVAGYAAERGLRVLIENHGGYSSDAGFILDVIAQVDSQNLGTLPDFGNWCKKGKGSGIQADCDEAYDIYASVEAFMPHAGAVSAKSYDFDAQGNETFIDYERMLRIVKNAGYRGPIGIEYEGKQLSEPDGIRATRALIEKVWKTLE